MNKQKSPIVLAILDGWGIGPNDKSVNAIAAAKKPFFDQIIKKSPHCQLNASGCDVGLEKNQMSGSETGHLNIGAGRIVKQDIRVILEAVDNGGFFHNPALLSTVNHIRANGSNLHLMGLLGDKDSPHAHPDTLLALLIFAKKSGLADRTFLHLFTDGRDSFPQSAMEHWQRLAYQMKSLEVGKLASVSGRFYGMDRTKNWDRLLKAYNAMVLGEGDKCKNFAEIIRNNYQKNNTDEYVEPAVIIERGKPVGKISDNDGVIFFNQRSDRARQLSKLFVGTNTRREQKFPRHLPLKNLAFVAMTDFGPDLDLKTAFDSRPILQTLPATLSGLKQLYIAETEKFAHVTYFFNGGYPDSIGGEERIMINSLKVRSYAQTPQMSAGEITSVIEKNIRYGIYDLTVVNFANADMVGHTGDFKATVQAVSFIDKQLLRIYKELIKKNGTLVVTADHGNADLMIDKKTKRPFTFHTKNPVPFIIANEDKKYRNLKLEDGRLGNIASTLLDILQIKKPEEMKLESLIKHSSW